MTDAPDEERRTRPFADVLTSLQRGRTHRELSAALQQLTEEVMATHRGGTLTLTLKVSKSKASGMVEIDDDVRVKLPAQDRATSLFYVDNDANLVRDDPHQLALPVGPVRVADDIDSKAAGE